MTAAEQDAYVLGILVGIDQLSTAKQVVAIARDGGVDLSLPKVSACLGRLRQQGRVQMKRQKCLVCDGRGRSTGWLALASPDTSDAQQEACATPSGAS